MIANGSQCPSNERLVKHSHNELPCDDEIELDRHLAVCPICFKRYVELGRDSVVRDIPGYHVVKLIGRGRFGVVYKAWQLGDKPRRVALKILNSPGEMERNRFDREITVLKKLESPRIVKCLDSGTTGDSMYYVMDYVDGVHLDEYLKSSAHELNDKLAILELVCRAVADAHAEGVVHRDLKPGNILIDSHGQPHILDFGICSLETSEWSSWERFTITHPGDVIGTLKYMSPEQAWGGAAGTIDERTDMWALGVMLYSVVTGGQFPYSLEPDPDRPIHEAVLDRIRNEMPRIPRLDKLPRGRDLQVLLERCLAWDPDQRVATAILLADDLGRYQSGEPIQTKRLSTLYRAKRLAVGLAAHARWVYSALFLAVIASALWLIPLFTTVGWSVRGDVYQGVVAPVTSEAVDARDGILVAGVFDDTAQAVMNFAAQKGIKGVTPAVTTWRAVHGYLMQRLAGASPKAVVWDYFFRSPRQGDALLAAGINKLEEAGVPVILGVKRYRDDGLPELSSDIIGSLTGHLRHGTIAARKMVERPREFVTAIKRPDGTVLPSMPLTTLAAILHPHTLLDVDWSQRATHLTLLYAFEPAAYLRERDRLKLTRVFKSNVPASTIRTGDLVGCTTFQLDNPPKWQKRTVPYQQLLVCPDEELRNRVANKVIIVGNLVTKGSGFVPDRHPVQYGSTVINNVPGCYLQGEAIAGLLSRRYIKSALPLTPVGFALMLIAAAAGCLIPIKLGGLKVLQEKRNRWVLQIVLWSATAACLAVTITADGFTSVHVGMAGFAFLIPMAGSFWVEFARTRHRVSALRTQKPESWGLSLDSGTTLQQMQSRSHPKTT